MKFCPNCGSKNEDRMNFCSACGTRLEAVVQTGAQNAYREGGAGPENTRREGGAGPQNTRREGRTEASSSRRRQRKASGRLPLIIAVILCVLLVMAGAAFAGYKFYTLVIDNGSSESSAFDDDDEDDEDDEDNADDDDADEEDDADEDDRDENAASDGKGGLSGVFFRLAGGREAAPAAPAVEPKPAAEAMPEAVSDSEEAHAGEALAEEAYEASENGEVSAELNGISIGGIDSDTTTDYSAALDPEDYYRYDSGIGDFSFYYSPALYNDVYAEDSGSDALFGALGQSVRFLGTDASELDYMLYYRQDTLGTEEMLDETEERLGEIIGEYTVLKRNNENGRGTLVLTGARGRLNYYMLARIDDADVMIMEMINPNDVSDSELQRMNYVTENYYRMCGFSGYTKGTRTYEEYLMAQ